MRAIPAIALLVLYLAVQFRPLLPLVEYAMNKEAIAALCENKNKPELKCHGMCRVQAKVIQLDPTTEQTPQAPPVSQLVESVVCLAEGEMHLKDIYGQQTASYGIIESANPSTDPDNIFRPPQLLV